MPQTGNSAGFNIQFNQLILAKVDDSPLCNRAVFSSSNPKNAASS